MGIKPKKSLGQHFLRDQNILRNITLAVDAHKGERVVEIGPGEGALTEWLLKAFDDVLAIELDRRAVEMLEARFPDLQVRHGDILKENWQDVLLPDGNNVVVGNIPYYITSPILFKLMDAGPVFRKSILLMQKEVAERLVAGPGTKAYGILSVQSQLLGSVEYLFDVSRHVFYPKPKVESAVIAFYPSQDPLPVQPAHLKAVVRTAFNQRRKKLSNSIKALLEQQNTQDIDFDLNLRPDQLYPKQFLELTRKVYASEYE